MYCIMKMNKGSIIQLIVVSQGRKEDTVSYNRKNKILELIQTHEIETQQQMVELLQAEGYNATQATISRDIRDLKLIKTSSPMGKSHYAVAPKAEAKLSDRFIKILKETIRDVKCAENLIVVRTLNGCANAAAEALDSTDNEEIVGTLAGDNTFLIIVDKTEHVEKIVNKIQEIIS